MRPARGPERVAWNPRDEVVEALAPFAVSPLQALSHLPLLPVSVGQAEAFFRHGGTPATPPGIRLGERCLMVDDAELLAVLEARTGGQTKSLWRRPNHA